MRKCKSIQGEPVKVTKSRMAALLFAGLLGACGGGNESVPTAAQVEPLALRVTSGRSAASSNLLANPGFERGDEGWLLKAGGNYAIVTDDASFAHGGLKYAWLGGYDSANDSAAQNITIAAGATEASLQFWYRISTKETTSTGDYDKMTVEVLNPSTGARLALLKTYSNLDKTVGWVQSAKFDLSAWRGQTLRLQFLGTTDSSDVTSFLLDDLQLTVTEPPPWPAVATVFDGSVPPIFSGARADYNVTRNSDGSVTVIDRNGGSGIQVFTNVTRMVFADGALAFDFEGSSGQLYRLYQSVFNRKPDPVGLGFYTFVLDNGSASYGAVADSFIKSKEFTDSYGALSDRDFVTRLYANVLGRAPDAAGLTWHVGHLDGTNPDGARLTRAEVLATFSESEENRKLVLPAIQSGIGFQSWAGAKPVCSAGATLQGGVCGKVTLSCTLPQVLQNGVCKLPAPGLLVSATGSANTKDASAVIATRSGSVISYFTDAGSRRPTEAVVTAPTGGTTRVHYAKNGALQKIVDPRTGNYVSIRLRTDLLGADYLLYDKLGTFVSGYTLYKNETGWYHAPVKGEFGQFTGNFSGGVNGSFAMKANHLVYGTPTRLANHLGLLLDGTPASGVPFSATMLDLVLPSAHAALSEKDRGTLFSGMALMIMGGVLGGPSNPAGSLLMIGGAVQIYRGLTSNLDANLDLLDGSVNQILSDRAASDLENGTEPLASTQNGLLGLLERGINNIKSKVMPTITRLAGTIPGFPAPQYEVDVSVPEKPLPAARGDSTALVGTMVDSANRIYNAYGTMDQTGQFEATGDSNDSVKLKLTGKVETTGTTTHKSCVQTNAAGATAGTCIIASNSKLVPIGACQSSSQSGGNGTFSFAYNLGKSDGSVAISYDMFSIPDAMTVIGGGQVLFTTGGLVSGARSVTLTFSGDSSVIVNLSAPKSGTAWKFTIGCGS